MLECVCAGSGGVSTKEEEWDGWDVVGFGMTSNYLLRTSWAMRLVVSKQEIIIIAFLRLLDQFRI